MVPEASFHLPPSLHSNSCLSLTLSQHHKISVISLGGTHRKSPVPEATSCCLAVFYLSITHVSTRSFPFTCILFPRKTGKYCEFLSTLVLGIWMPTKSREMSLNHKNCDPSGLHIWPAVGLTLKGGAGMQWLCLFQFSYCLSPEVINYQRGHNFRVIPLKCLCLSSLPQTHFFFLFLIKLSLVYWMLKDFSLL